MAAIRVTFEGDKAMKRRFERAIEATPKELRRALVEVANRKLPIVQARTPVRTGALQRSVRVRVMVSQKKEDLRVTIIAGGPGIPYAARVHETHKTKSKFIESVILESVPTIGKEIAGELDLRQMVPA